MYTPGFIENDVQSLKIKNAWEDKTLIHIFPYSYTMQLASNINESISSVKLSWVK